MLEITFEYDSRVEDLDEKIKVAVAEKLTALTRIMYEKVQDNLSGKILQSKSGQLLTSIQQRVDVSSNPMVGSVYPEPASPKAWALEKGGEESYAIFPSKASVLKFYWDKLGQTMYLRHVNHPPSKEFAYLRLALEEMETLVPAGFKEAIDQVLGQA